jgi:hypothetical protein
MQILLFAIQKYLQRMRKLDYRENNPLYMLYSNCNVYFEIPHAFHGPELSK